MINKKLSRIIDYSILTFAIAIVTFIVFNFWTLGDDIVFSDWFSKGMSIKDIITVRGVNGRYIGNTLGILFSYLSSTKYWYFRNIFDLICIFSLTYFSIKLMPDKIKSTNKFILFIILLFSANEYAYVEFFSCSSGFMNYFLSITLLSFNFYIFEKNKIHSSGAKEFILSIGIILNCFFIEFITVYILFVSFFYFIYSIINKKNHSISIKILISSIIGAGAMFAYKYINYEGPSDYRKSIFSYGIQLVIENIQSYAKNIVFSHLILTLVLSSVCVLYLIKTFKTYRLKIISLIQIVVFLIGILTSIMLRYDCFGISFFTIFINDIFTSILSLLYILNLGVFIFKLNSKEKNKLIFIYISFLFICAVLCCVSPIGWRCFLCLYIMLIHITITVIHLISETSNHKKFNCFMILLVLIFATYSFHIATEYYKANQLQKERIEYINAEMKLNKKEILVPDSINFCEAGSLRFLGKGYYYDVEDDITFKYIPYDEWLLKYYK